MSTSEQVKTTLAEQLGVKIENITDTTTFEDLGADSLDKIEITLQLEDNFKIEIPDDEAEKLLTVGNVVKYIEEKLKKE